jgi:hypothetical protein
MQNLKQTHTYSILEVSQATYDEIKAKLEEVDYQHTFHEDDEHGLVIDMHGIAIAKEK